MLTLLSISNYALIDSLELEPDPHFSIITGETGAGKSIMLGALSLLLGGKADTKVITDKEKKTVVEATFLADGIDIAGLLADIDPDWTPDAPILLRREISPSGRSRALVNDSAVKLSQLEEIASRLIDIHSQHSNRLLISAPQQLSLIDTLADDAELLDDYRRTYMAYAALRHKIKQIREENERNRASNAVFEFQLAQLDKLNPQPGELEEVERRFDILSDAEEIRSHLSLACGSLQNDEGALSMVDSAMGALQSVDMELFEDKPTSETVDTERDDSESFGEPADSLSTSDFTLLERLHQVRIELKDIAETIADYVAEVNADPAELARVSARMNLLYEAQKQFHVNGPNGLSDLRDDLRRKLANLSDGNSDLATFEAEAKVLGRSLKEKAEKLTEVRTAAAREFSETLCDVARPLGLPNLKFEVDFQSAKLSRDGGDLISFRCSFNKNMPLRDIAEVASGGEISRLMLSIKYIVADKISLPTVIFDEIDTGVSGEIADKMGAMMRRMGEETQVIAITHLPQVASKGFRHFKVAKKDLPERTVSSVTMLSDEERVREIAAMISGEKINEAALQAAKNLLDIG